MTEFLVRRFVKNSDKIKEAGVRTAYGVLSSVVGILCNLLLFGTKLMVGFFLNSISVMADAFNNLSDAASSIIGFIGVKMAERPADEEHPFGHGRIEYIAAFIVAFLVIQVGFSFLKGAVDKIREPEELKFQAVSIIILLLSICIKLWLGMFNRKLGKRINSKVMLATAADSLGDVVTTSATILSVVVYYFSGLNIDGFVGLFVALIVMWAGVGIARDTLAPLIGEAIDPELGRKIKEFVEEYDGIVGSHDLIIHNYGPSKSMASIHAEVPNDTDIEESHEIIDRIEKDAYENMGILLTIHMDPIETKDEFVLKARRDVEEVVAGVDSLLSIHDFRLVDGRHQINLIFDMIVPHEYGHEKQKEVTYEVISRLKDIDPRYNCVINVEKSYMAGSQELS